MDLTSLLVLQKGISQFPYRFEAIAKDASEVVAVPFVSCALAGAVRPPRL